MATASPAKDPKEVAMRSRILSHMNDDHQDSLSHFVRHHYNVSEDVAANAKLVDINFKQVVIVAKGQCYTVPIVPPMLSFSEARERMVAMDTEAREALGLPMPDKASFANAHANGHSNGTANGHADKAPRPSIVDHYVPPSGFHLVVFLACLSTFVVFSRPENIRPGSPIYDRALRHVPVFADFCQRIQFWLLSGMCVIHGIEAGIMGFGSLRRHGVAVGSPLWFQWTASAFVEGVGSFQRLNTLATQKNKEYRE